MMQTASTPIIPLGKDTQRKLLGAIRSDQLNLINFPELRPQAEKSMAFLSTLTQQETSRFQELCVSLNYKPMYVLLTRSLKIRLLEAVRAGELRLEAFPEINPLSWPRTIDPSMLSDEDADFLVDLAEKIR